MTPSQEYLAKYKHIEREADSLGRIIGVGRLRPSQQIKISEMTPGLEGDTEMSGPNGEPIRMSRRGIPLLAASVREIDNNPIMFPRNRAELDSIMDQLDEPGMTAALQAMLKLNPPKPETDDGELLDVNDQAKK